MNRRELKDAEQFRENVAALHQCGPDAVQAFLQELVNDGLVTWDQIELEITKLTEGIN